MITYEFVEENHNDVVLGKYTSFGVKAIENDSDLQLVYVEDVFSNIETAQEYISLFNNAQLDLIHLKEVIEDILIKIWQKSYCWSYVKILSETNGEIVT